MYRALACVTVCVQRDWPHYTRCIVRCVFSALVTIAIVIAAVATRDTVVQHAAVWSALYHALAGRAGGLFPHWAAQMGLQGGRAAHGTCRPRVAQRRLFV